MGKSKQTGAKAAPRRKAVKPSKDIALILARAEQIINLLGGNYVVCDGWKMDKEAATRTLQYLRRIAAGAPENDREWKAVCEFFHDHGQSIDWIAMGDPGVMICRLASVSHRTQLLRSWISLAKAMTDTFGVQLRQSDRDLVRVLEGA